MIFLRFSYDFLTIFLRVSYEFLRILTIEPHYLMNFFLIKKRVFELQYCL